MKRPISPVRGFTLIELLVVMSIIMILAGLTFSLFGFANRKAATDRARAEISALSLAIESYKIDNGEYPRDTNTDELNPTSGNAKISDSAATPYMNASLTLYKALSGDTDANGQAGDVDTATNEKAKVYFEFKANMLYPKVSSGTARTGSVQALVDPFRSAYGYSTIYLADTTKTPPETNPHGYNPTFDLWSTADSEQTGATVEATWIKNW